MKRMMSSTLAALAVVTTLAAPAFAEESMPAAPMSTKGAQTVTPDAQPPMPFPKKWWTED